jgi:chromosomal replication initiation ATPase DnaA
VPNEFIATQVKKFFNKKLNEAIAEVFNPQFKVKIEIFPPFQSGRH